MKKRLHFLGWEYGGKWCHFQCYSNVIKTKKFSLNIFSRIASNYNLSLEEDSGEYIKIPLKCWCPKEIVRGSRIQPIAVCSHLALSSYLFINIT